ncbi:MAG: fibrillarin-like rRNA/tRNA 2'-O-methyltransferase [Thermoplasmata archaeon]
MNNKFLIRDKESLYTLNLVPGQSVYGEKLVKFKEGEYRFWNPYRSKLASLLMLKNIDFQWKKDEIVLYLGASTGTTVSHISDLIPQGQIYAIEFSKEPFLKLLGLAKSRKNILPILADAEKTEDYFSLVPKVDLIYQDIAQPNQVDILVKNSQTYLGNKGEAIFMAKLMSIDSSKNPSEIAKKVEESLDKTFIIKEEVSLEKYEKDHYAFYLSLK